MRGSNPKQSRDAVWTVVDEAFDPKVRIPDGPWKAIQSMSFLLSRVLWRDDSAHWAPRASIEDRSLTAEVAFNLAILQQKIKPGQAQHELYHACKLRKKDEGRPRLHLLVREPNRAEVADPVANKYMIK